MREDKELAMVLEEQNEFIYVGGMLFSDGSRYGSDYTEGTRHSQYLILNDPATQGCLVHILLKYLPDAFIARPYRNDNWYIEELDGNQRFPYEGPCRGQVLARALLNLWGNKTVTLEEE